MALEIKHALYRSCAGSSRLVSGDSVATVVVQGPADAPVKAENYSELTVEVKFKCAANPRAADSFISWLISKLLCRYVMTELDKGRTLTVHVCANTADLPLVCNAVLVACLDAGIPLRRPFYCAGNSTSLFVVEDGEVVPIYTLGAATKEDLEKALADAEYVQESIRYGIRDMFVFK